MNHKLPTRPMLPGSVSLFMLSAGSYLDAAGVQESDEAINRSVSSALHAWGQSLNTSTAEGVVTLQGTVGSQLEKDCLISSACAVPGVSCVVDDLKICGGNAVTPLVDWKGR